MTEIPGEDIPGWFDFADLYDLMVEKAAPGDTMVEVGVFLGRSLVYLASIAEAKKLNIVAVDNFCGSGNNEDVSKVVREHGGSILNAFTENLKRYGIYDRVTIYAGDSAGTAEGFRDGSFQFVFVDADHSYEAVKKDIAAWLPKIKSGGYIGGHDYAEHSEGVKKAVDEIFGSNVKLVSNQCWLVEVG
ncbi:MAG: class I SAM-dependent methyltransferase [Thiothrix sp.]|uniref:class I SAM-dependent methyltransferase n=1 Tax=Thiothrix sp. TaxID=1032 RepID=UPI002629FF4D|nr:class I SAM-dependent methyltransferase [Thiothrix sp.]MDD5394923.1 class I SAM-dependent methyltransferase [Thiothrix sp.]